MGLVTMKAGDDARTSSIHLSRKGKNTYKRAAPLWHGVQKQMLERLGRGGRDPLDQILETLTAPVVAI
jgi:hypothetical protein